MSLILGYDSEAEIRVTGLDLPPDAVLVAQIRTTRASSVLATLSTAAGTIEIASTDTIRLKFPGSMTANWSTQTLYFDVVRTDGVGAQHLGFEGRLTFHEPVTRL